MKFAWSACIVVVAGLGLAGVVAEGCGGDDDNGGAAGTGGSTGGKGGAGSSTGGAGTVSTGGAGSSGSSGTSGGGTGGTGGVVDAGLTDAEVQACLHPDGGSLMVPTQCLADCFCTTCPKEATKCYGDPGCGAIVQSAARTGCAAVPSTCFDAGTCGNEINEGGAGALDEALAFATCGTGCNTKCATEAGTPEAGSEAGHD